MLSSPFSTARPRSSSLSFLFLALLALCWSFKSTTAQYTPLTSNVPLTAAVPVSSTAYFTFTPTYASDALILSVAAASGYPTLNAANGSVAYSASTADGGALLIDSAGTGAWTLWVSSDAASASNFTVVASEYDPTVPLTTAILFRNAVAQASVGTAGLYRYFTIDASATAATQLSIAVTQSSSVVLILANKPGNAALPTTAVTDTSSINSTLQLLTIPLTSSSARGVYTIGIFSAVTTPFTITASTVGTRTIQPLPYGVVYPGYGLQGVMQYFSFYVDAVQLRSGANLRILLYSLTGDADLYCATFAYPTVSNNMWQSSLYAQLDEITVLASQLRAGLIYCTVLADIISTFTFTADFDEPSTLSPEDVLYVRTNAGDNSFFSITIPGNATTQGYCVVSVTAEYGAVQLYGNGYPRQVYANQGMPWTSPTSQPLQALPIPIRDACSLGAIAGSDPPSCGINLLVVSDAASQFRLSVEIGGSGSILLAGQVFAGAVGGGGVFLVQINIPDNLSNVSLLVTMADPLVNATLSVGRNDVARNSSLFSVQQVAGNPVLYWTLDPSNPLLFPRGSQSGWWTAYITAPNITTFTVLYSISTGGYNGSPTQLIPGEPQYGMLPVGAVNFYTFIPPSTGWPFSTVISCTFVSGIGSLTTTTGDGTIAGPTPNVGLGNGRYVWLQATLSIEPTDTFACNPNVTLPSGLPCIYQMAVQARITSTVPLVYYITATPGSSLRQISNYQTINSVIDSGGVEYWQLQYQVGSNTQVVQMLAAATMQQGQALLLGSNLTSLVNASTAQQQWAVESTALINYQGVAANTAYYFVAVQCVSAVACQYSLQYVGYLLSYASDAPFCSVAVGSTTTLLMTAGSASYCSIAQSGIRTVSSLILQGQPLVGSASLFAALTSAFWPNSSTYTWAALGPGPTSVEITNVTIIPLQFPLLRVTVQAGAVDSVIVLSFDVAGVSAALPNRGSLTGALTPAYPVSYFSFLLNSISSASMLSFGVYSTTCPADLTVYISDTLPAPGPGGFGVTYNYSATTAVLPAGRSEASVLISNATSPSLRATTYYMAVVSAGTSSCSFTASVNSGASNLLVADATSPSRTIFGGVVGQFFATFTMTPNTPVAFVIQLSRTNTHAGTLTALTALGGLPNPADDGSYSLVSNYTVTAMPTIPPQPTAIFLPGSLCPSTPQSLASGCPVAIGMSTDANSVQYTLTTMLTAQTVAEAQSVIGAVSLTSLAYYQLPVPAVPGVISIILASSALVQLDCSYQFIRPSPGISEWSTSVNLSSTPISIHWKAPLLNAVNGVATQAQACYCGVSAVSGVAGFVFSYTFTAASTPAPSTSSSSSDLSAGLLFTAIFVPLVVALAALAVLGCLCHRRGGCQFVFSEGVRKWKPSSHGEKAGGVGEDGGSPSSELQSVSRSAKGLSNTFLGDAAVRSEE